MHKIQILATFQSSLISVALMQLKNHYSSSPVGAMPSVCTRVPTKKLADV